MHLIIATRGEQHAVQKFIEQLSGQYVPAMLKMGNDKKLQKYHIQPLIRPVQLWDIGIPKEHLDLFLNTFRDVNENKRYAKVKWIVDWVRKKAGFKDIPKDYKKDRILPCAAAKKDMDIMVLGLKDDGEIRGGMEAI